MWREIFEFIILHYNSQVAMIVIQQCGDDLNIHVIIISHYITSLNDENNIFSTMALLMSCIHV